MKIREWRAYLEATPKPTIHSYDEQRRTKNVGLLDSETRERDGILVTPVQPFRC